MDCSRRTASCNSLDTIEADFALGIEKLGEQDSSEAATACTWYSAINIILWYSYK